MTESKQQVCNVDRSSRITTVKMNAAPKTLQYVLQEDSSIGNSHKQTGKHSRAHS